MMNKFRNDKGFSLIELIVAVLIMAIASGGLIMGVSVVFNARVSAASKIVINQMKRARSAALALENETSSDDTTTIFVEFKQKSDGNFYAEVFKKGATGTADTLLSSEKLCNDNVSITFSNHSDPTTFKTVGNGEDANYVRVYFKKNTGGISLFEVCKADGTGSVKTMTFDTICLKGTSETDNIIIVGATGRCYMDE